MSYLVYCPTCNHTMSVNATQCPHCGEHEFTQSGSYEASRPCYYCDGKGWEREQGTYESGQETGKRFYTGNNVVCPECSGTRRGKWTKHTTTDIRKKV